MGEQTINVGQKLRGLRKIRGISLRQLSEETGMSYSYLSGLENDKHSISVNTLQRLAGYFGVDLWHFLDTSAPQPVLIKQGEGNVTLTEDGISFNLITSEDADRLQVTFVDLPANTPTERHIHKHPRGEEFITVLEGEIVFLIEDQRYVMHKGDSVFFAAEREHAIFTENRAARIILVSSPPNGRGYLRR